MTNKMTLLQQTATDTDQRNLRSAVETPPIECYLPVGCLISGLPSESLKGLGPDSTYASGWIEILSSSPGFNKCQLGVPAEASVQRLLRASWIRLCAKEAGTITIYRVYWLPNDVARIAVFRDSKSLQSDAELVLSVLLTSPDIWRGVDIDTPYQQSFDPFAQKEEGSLFYIFNTLPSPNPHPQEIQDRFARAAVLEILNYTTTLPGLKTLLYPYQARSAAAMLRLESSTELHHDPRFEHRIAPDGSKYYFVPRELTFYKHPQRYTSNCGGILAETMGLG
jgi:hypothetical protein